MPSPAEFLQTVKLPVMSEVAHLLVQTLNEREASVNRVRDVIAKDPALTTTLVRMANSAMFGLSRSVHSLEHAISVVGMSQIRARALSICLTDVFPVSSGLDRTEFWRASLAGAAYAGYLAGRLGMDEQQAWLTGMMLRLGELLIAQRNPDLIAECERPPHGPGKRWARQRELLGFDECQVTSALAQRWDFPAEMVAALNAGGQPMVMQPFSALGAVVHLAGLLADAPKLEASTPGLWPGEVLVALRLEMDDALLDGMPKSELLTELTDGRR